MRSTVIFVSLALIVTGCGYQQTRASGSPRNPNENTQAASSNQPPRPSDTRNKLLKSCPNSLCRSIASRIIDQVSDIMKFLFDVDKFNSRSTKVLNRLKLPLKQKVTVLHSHSCAVMSNYIYECAPPVIDHFKVTPMVFLHGCLHNIKAVGYHLSEKKSPPTPLMIWMSSHICGLKARGGCKSFLKCFGNNDPSYYFAVGIDHPTSGLKNFQSLPADHHHHPKGPAASQ